MTKPLPDLPDLLPGFAERLEARAEAVAAAHRAEADHVEARPRRRRFRRAGAGAAAVLVLASGAYAAGLWNPPLGSNASDAPVASNRPVSAELLDRIGALREPQREADRGAAASYALRFPATSETAIQTRAVRTRTLPSGATAVLVPTIDRATGGQHLCLWVQSTDDHPARTCAAAAEVLDGRLVLSVERRPSSASEEERARRRRDAQGGTTGAGGVTQAPTGGAVRVVGVVPDGVRAARFGDAPPVAVRDGLVEARLSAPPSELRARWDD